MNRSHTDLLIWLKTCPFLPQQHLTSTLGQRWQVLTPNSWGLRHSPDSSWFYPVVPVLVQELKHDVRTVYIMPIIRNS